MRNICSSNQLTVLRQTLGDTALSRVTTIIENLNRWFTLISKQTQHTYTHTYTIIYSCAKQNLTLISVPVWTVYARIICTDHNAWKYSERLHQVKALHQTCFISCIRNLTRRKNVKVSFDNRHTSSNLAQNSTKEIQFPQIFDNTRI